MAKQLIIVLALVAAALADESSYAAPSAYNSPSGYGAPTAPQDGYGVADSLYGAPASYGEPASGYGAPVSDDGSGDLFNLDKLFELLPFFLAVFVAIILAQLLTPLLNLLPGILSPFGNVKIDFINLLLSPFSLAICNTTPTVTIAGSGRSFGHGFSANPEYIDMLTSTLYDVIQKYQTVETEK